MSAEVERLRAAAALVCPACSGDNVCGHEISEVYDGVLFWSCLDCLHAWARDWTGFGSRQEVADRYAAWFRAATATPSPNLGTP